MWALNFIMHFPLHSSKKKKKQNVDYDDDAGDEMVYIIVA